MKTGIPLLDSVIEMFPWDKSEEYEKIAERYGPEIKDILAELVLLPLLHFDSINDLSHAIGNDKNRYYDLLKDSRINWINFMHEVTLYLFLTMLQDYQRHTDPSFRSRWRPHLIVDDTLIRRWNRRMARCDKVYNYVDKHYMYGQKLIFLVVSFGDKLIFPVLCEISAPAAYAVRRTSTQKVVEAITNLYLAAMDEGLSFSGVRLVGDAGYTCQELAQVATTCGLEYYGTAKAKWNFTLADGATIKCHDLHTGQIPVPQRQGARIGQYFRLYATHETLGPVVLFIFPCQEQHTDHVKYWVHLSTTLTAACNVIHLEHRARWAIEWMFRLFKQTLGLRFFQGIAYSGQTAWFVLTSFRFIFLRLAFRRTKRLHYSLVA